MNIEEGYWCVSTDSGQTWTELRRVTGEDGEDGVSMFREIRQDDIFVYFVLFNEQTIKLQKSCSVKKYGVRWSITDMDDLGARCFDAVGKKVSIGIGNKNGFSDFDKIYPWSEIRRCNILTNYDGTKRITFEGDAGFSLDGSNGDVFVRIPKYRVEKIVKDGYEYRVISYSEGRVHPAFIEDGKELNEIYVGAFEGYINDGRLMSIGGVIPTSNLVA